MARIKIVAESGDNPDLSELYTEMLANGFGTTRPFNFFTSQGGRPDIMRATWGLARTMLTSGQLSPAVKQMITVAISHQNACQYCEVVHSSALEGMGVSRETIASCAADLELKGLAPSQREVVKFAVKAAQSPGDITDADVDELRDYGLEEGEIIEVMMMAAFSNFVNTWASLSGIPVDDGLVA